MSRFGVVLASAVLIVTAGVLIGLNGCGGSHSSPPPPPPPPPPPGQIKHVVIIFQENRTPDNLFQDPVLIGRGADIHNSGINSQGQTIPLSLGSLVNDYDPEHSHKAFNQMCDLNTATGQCKMDGADLIRIYCNPNATNCPPPNAQFMYIDPTEVQPYFQLAEQYAFGDRMFQTNQGPSFPAHQFIISGTSAPSATSNLFAAENTNGAGCAAPSTAMVWLVDPSGRENSETYPCFEHPTLTDSLDAKGISWRYYVPTPDSVWTAPDAIQHICQPQTQNGQLACSGSLWSNVFIPQTQVLTDIASNQLPTVTWVIPEGKSSDHPAGGNGTGPSWVASIVNAIGNSQYWGSTAIFITWDDWGGWYDHVPPPQVLVNCSKWGCGYVYGFRVPLIVVSPYAKASYISHQTHDFGSILKFIEQTFNLPSLGYADANADDLSDCFNFSQTPLPFHTIAAPVSAEQFLKDRTPPTDPDTD